MTEQIQAFVSYSHDSVHHKALVLEMAQQLRDNGIDCQIDRFVKGHPPEGWPTWMANQVESANFVLVVCSATFLKRYKGTESRGKGLGASWEAVLSRQVIYEAQRENVKFIPVLLEHANVDDIPIELRQFTHYALPDQLHSLLRYMHGVPDVVPRPLGKSPFPASTPPSIVATPSAVASGAGAAQSTTPPATLIPTPAQLDILEFVVEAYLESGKWVTGRTLRIQFRSMGIDKVNETLDSSVPSFLRDGGRQRSERPHESYSPSYAGLLASRRAADVVRIVEGLVEFLRKSLLADSNFREFKWSEVWPSLGLDEQKDFNPVVALIQFMLLMGQGSWGGPPKPQFTFSIPHDVEAVIECHDLQSLIELRLQTYSELR